MKLCCPRIIRLDCIICLVDAHLQLATAEVSTPQGLVSRAKKVLYLGSLHLPPLSVCILISEPACRPLHAAWIPFCSAVAVSSGCSRGHTPAVPAATVTNILCVQSVELPGPQVKC